MFLKTLGFIIRRLKTFKMQSLSESIAKVLIYGPRHQEVLVFQEPDFPDVPLQVPGGTIDAGETPKSAAAREFKEETGLHPPMQFRFIGQYQEVFCKDGSTIKLNRHAFQLPLPVQLPRTWDHWEENAHDGAPPILFRFFWLSFEDAQERLGLGMAKPISQIRDFARGSDPSA